MKKKLVIYTLIVLPSLTFGGDRNHMKWKERKTDWRNGPIVYQVFVDRFAPPQDIKSKLDLFKPPRKLMKWDQLPKKGHYLKDEKVWSHEIQFWGGDLKSLQSKLDYIKELGADVIYLNPIFEAFTNHKYDTIDYMRIDPAYGTNDDLKSLIDAVHKNGIKLVLDGVFNHMSVRSPLFTAALKKDSTASNFFKLTNTNKLGYIGWWNVENLPELNFNEKKVRDYIYARPSSVVQTYLKQIGIDGWRLDVAYDLGYNVLADITRHAHRAKRQSLVIGEVWNYPAYWKKVVDAISNMHGRQIILELAEGKISPEKATAMWENMVRDVGIDYILKCWLMLDNHDTPRLANIVKDIKMQKITRFLQLTLPGAAYLYYGSELGMSGGDDPEQRAPMRWDLVKHDNDILSFHKKLISIRKTSPALRYGDFITMNAKNLVAFMRTTDKVAETVIILANPTSKAVKESIQVRDGRVNSWTFFKDALSGRTSKVVCGIMDVEMRPFDMMILKIDTSPTKDGYDRYEGMDGEIGLDNDIYDHDISRST